VLYSPLSYNGLLLNDLGFILGCGFVGIWVSWVSWVTKKVVHII
jgi:hypothetical protein